MLVQLVQPPLLDDAAWATACGENRGFAGVMEMFGRRQIGDPPAFGPCRRRSAVRPHGDGVSEELNGEKIWAVCAGMVEERAPVDVLALHVTRLRIQLLQRLSET